MIVRHVKGSSVSRTTPSLSLECPAQSFEYGDDPEYEEWDEVAAGGLIR